MTKRMMTLEWYRDKRDKWRARVKAGNGKILARTPRGYATEADLDKVLTVMFSKQYDIDPYKDRANEWRWRFELDDHGCIMISSEGYKNLQDCQHASDLVLDATIPE